ncbi:MAG: Fis family transcriptional regulator [Campylobacterales bacterium]|nr:Fis family transcriptional regulator [Campylobacterales bacterium]
MEQFLTNNEQIKSIIKNINITRTLFLSSMIVGEEHIGKLHLASYLFPTATVVNAAVEDVNEAIKDIDEAIITHFEKVKNIDNLDFSNKRIIALATYISNKKVINDKFAFIYQMPSLQDRPEDIELLANYFLNEAKENLSIEREIELDYTTLDTAQNFKSLKKSVYRELLYASIDTKDIEKIMYNFLLKQYDNNIEEIYKQFLPLYEKPLIEAGLDKFGSQLKLSTILGINRNTLRKKINELNLN